MNKISKRSFLNGSLFVILLSLLIVAVAITAFIKNDKGAEADVKTVYEVGSIEDIYDVYFSYVGDNNVVYSGAEVSFKLKKDLTSLGVTHAYFTLKASDICEYNNEDLHISPVNEYMYFDLSLDGIENGEHEITIWVKLVYMISGVESTSEAEKLTFRFRFYDRIRPMVTSYGMDMDPNDPIMLTNVRTVIKRTNASIAVVEFTSNTTIKTVKYRMFNLDYQHKSYSSSGSIKEDTYGPTDRYGTILHLIDEGWHTFIAIDSENNQTEFSFCIDRTTSSQTTVTNSNGNVISKSYSNKDVKITTTDVGEFNIKDKLTLANGDVRVTNSYYSWEGGRWRAGGAATWTGNGNKLKGELNLTKDGKHEIEVTDKLGNLAKEFVVYIDKTGPLFNSIDASGVISNSGVYVKATQTVTISDYTLNKVYYKYSTNKDASIASSSNRDESRTRDNYNWNSDSSGFLSTNFRIEKEGWHSFLAVDNLGNESRFTICYETMAPILNIKTSPTTNVLDGTAIKIAPYFEIEEQFNNSYTFSFEYDSSGIFYALDKLASFRETTVYFDTRDTYAMFYDPVFYTEEECKNYILNKETPRISGKMTWNGVVGNKIIIAGEIPYAITGANCYEYQAQNGDIYIFFDKARLDQYVYNASVRVYLSHAINRFSIEGKFRVTVKDSAGNQTRKVFTLDYQCPVTRINSEKTWHEDKIYTKADIVYSAVDYLSGVQCIMYKKVEDKSWRSENANTITIPSTIENNGVWQIKVVDLAGNESPITEITLDKIAPIVSIYKMDGTMIADIDSVIVGTFIYFKVVEVSDTGYSILVQQEIADGVYSAYLGRWQSFREATVYYDIRDISYDYVRSTNNQVFYTEELALNQIEKNEKMLVRSYPSWTTSIAGIIEDSEKPYAIEGIQYYTYSATDEEVYIFFDQSRLDDFIKKRLRRYLGISPHHYFFEEGNIKLTVMDIAGNTTILYVTCDNRKPDGWFISSFSQHNNEFYSNVNVEYEGTDSLSGVSKILSRHGESGNWTSVDGVSVIISANSENNGYWEFKSQDRAGNESPILSIIIDIYSPIIEVNKNLKNYNSGYHNDKLIFDITDDNLDTLTLDDKSYIDGDWIKSEDYWYIVMYVYSYGAHIVTVYDLAGNNSSYEFILDATPPKITTNKNVYAKNETVVVYIEEIHPDKSYINGIEFYSMYISTSTLHDGINTITATDKAFNTGKITFIVDNTPPEYVLKNFYNAGEDIVLTVIETGGSYVVRLDGEILETEIFNFLGKPLDGYGSHVINVTDEAGNKVEKTFFYGTTSPKLAIIKGDSYLTGTVYLKLGEIAYLQVIEQQLSHVKINGKTVNLVMGGSGEYLYELNSSELNETTYLIQAYDLATNITTQSLVIDKTPPKLTITRGGIKETSMMYLKDGENIKISVEDVNLDCVNINDDRESSNNSSLTISINTASYGEGTYHIVVYDKAGNSAKQEYVIDKTSPNYELSKNGIAVPSNTYFKADDKLSSAYADNYSEVYLYVIVNSIKYTPTSFNETITVGAFLANSDHVRRYQIVDLAGNVSEFTVNVDLTTPKLTLKKNGGDAEATLFISELDILSLIVDETNIEKITLDSTNTMLQSWQGSSLFNGQHSIAVYDKAGNESNAYFIVDREKPIFSLAKGAKQGGLTYFGKEDLIEFSITEDNTDNIFLDNEIYNQSYIDLYPLRDGIHILSSIDKAGNRSEIKFVVDRVDPKVQVKAGFSATFMSTGCFANASTIMYLSLDDENIDYFTFDGEKASVIPSISSLEDGEHTIKGYDMAGNVGVATFTIDRIPPTISLNKSMYKDGIFYYSAGVIIQFEVLDKNYGTTKLDSFEIEKDENLILSNEKPEGEHVLMATDKAGNVSYAYFVIDRTAPEVYIKAGYNGTLMSSGCYANSQSTLYQLIVDDYLDFWTIDETASSYLPSVEMLESGPHTIKAYDKAGNSGIATFIIDKLAPTLSFLNKMEYSDGWRYYNSDEVVCFSHFDDNLDKITLDGVKITDNAISVLDMVDGRHQLVALDLAGNKTVIEFVVDKLKPIVKLKKNAEEVETYGVFFKSGQRVQFIATDETSDIAIYLIDETVTILTSWDVSTLSDGLHKINVVDKAGNIETVTFIVDSTLPIYNVSEFYVLNDVINIDIDEINLFEIYFDGDIYESLSFLANDLSEDKHTIIVSDLAGNVVTKTFIVDLTNPTLSLYKNSLKVELGAFIKLGDEFSIQVYDKHGVSVYFDGEYTTLRLWKADDLDERAHSIVVEDLAGNKISSYFTVDKLSPIFYIEEYYLKSDRLTLEIEDSTPVLVLLNGTPTLDTEFNSIELGENIHVLTVIDSAGNQTEKIFTVDLTAPILKAYGFSREASPKTLTDELETSYGALTIATYDIAPLKLYYSKNDGEIKSVKTEYSMNLEFTIDGILENSGIWKFFAIDINDYYCAGMTIVLDFSNPSFEIQGITTVIGLAHYTNRSFIYSTENPFAKIHYSSSSLVDKVVANSIELYEDGIYTIYTEDAFFRCSPTITVTLVSTNDFKNILNINNSFKQNTWYKVTLPYSVFGSSAKPNIAGEYTFATYEDALSFSKEKEAEYRAMVVSDGISYVSMSNETVHIIYPNYDALDEAVTAYASKYISKRQIFSHVVERNSYYTIMPSLNGLTSNAPKLVSYLEEYGLSMSFARSTFSPIVNPNMPKSSIEMIYLGNLNGALERYSFMVEYNKPLYYSMEKAGSLYEGYYAFIERDICGNEQSAIIFIDFSSPYLKAQVERGDSTESIVIDKDLIGARNGVFYVTAFNLIDLLDDADNDFVSVYISGEGYYSAFTKGDLIPSLNNALGAGRYSITVYDRSFNLITFSVIVAGNAPYWNNTSLQSSAETATVYIHKNDQYNAFITLKLAKISSSGVYTYLEKDGVGVDVSVATLSYTLTSGGKYTIIIDDVYGRTIEFAPIFYEKGLPKGILNGVKQGGITKDEVSFDFSDTCKLDIFILTALDMKIPYIGPSYSYNAQHRTNTQYFSRTENETTRYLLVLSLIADLGIYIEYEFTIDAKAPTFSILSYDGEEYVENQAVNKPFLVVWGESNVNAQVSRAGKTSLTYISGSMIDIDGLYSFTLKDEAGNASSFTIYFDSDVQFSFSSEVKKISENVYLSNKTQSIIAGEEYTSFICEEKDGSVYSASHILDSDGEYHIAMVDVYANSLSIVLILDFTPPELVFENVKNGIANQSVIVKVDDLEADLMEMTSNYLNMKNKIRSGAAYSTDGEYYFKVIDLAGNTTQDTFKIDTIIDYNLSIPLSFVTTAGVRLIFNESVEQTLRLNDVEAPTYSFYSEVGHYLISASDEARNEILIEFTILPNRVREFDYEITDQYVIAKVTKGYDLVEHANVGRLTLTENGDYNITLRDVRDNKTYNFSVTVDAAPPSITLTEKNGTISFSQLTKRDSVATLYKDGILVEGYLINESIKGKGEYVLYLYDSLGNMQTYEFTLKNSISTISIVLIVIGTVLVALLVTIIIKGHKVKTV
ncbi:MAG: hypothetical protein LBU04_04800 [Christensenellaceae bacterium]|jgi:hypothetical protein|nr:hypothetical protein [Christensenellaceae bacterium]